MEQQSAESCAGLPVRVVVVLPAHNEEDNLAAAVLSLRRQTRPVNRIVVLADTCTDGTAYLARRLGCDVHATVANSAKKAGALNQALPGLLDGLGPDDVVLVMDADSCLGEEFVETALDRLAADPRLGAVGGVFYGFQGHGVVGQLQRNEYVRYAREISRRQARAVVLTGTGSAFRVQALRRVAAGRGVQLPGRPGDIYDTTALTEDNEMTLALKSLGYACLSPRQCRVSTEIMPGAKELWRQRMRWQRGALDNLRHYGWNRVTWPYICKQAFMYAGALMMVLYLALTAIAVATGAVTLAPFWVAVGGVFVLERIVTVREAGPRGIAVALTVLLEFGYDLFQMAVYMGAAWNHLLGRAAQWHHLGEEVTT